jgi:exodeoxyribonuclease VIII
MVDLETLGVSPDATILSIGAVSFSQEGIHAEFYIEVDLLQSRAIDPNTLKWWMQQENPPIHGIVPIREALLALYSFYNHHCGGGDVWCKGTDFDAAILANAARQFSLVSPWKYNAVRDCRTIFALMKELDPEYYDAWPENPNLHSALEDAKDQALRLIDYKKQLTGAYYYAEANHPN